MRGPVDYFFTLVTYCLHFVLYPSFRSPSTLLFRIPKKNFPRAISAFLISFDLAFQASQSAQKAFQTGIAFLESHTGFRSAGPLSCHIFLVLSPRAPTHPELFSVLLSVPCFEPGCRRQGAVLDGREIMPYKVIFSQGIVSHYEDQGILNGQEESM